MFPKVVSESAATHHELRKRCTLEFLENLRSPTRAMIDARQIAVVTAHPDDETIGCGAQLSRLSGVTVVTVTDGTPPISSMPVPAGIAVSAHRGARARSGLSTAGALDALHHAPKSAWKLRSGLELGPLPCILRA